MNKPTNKIEQLRAIKTGKGVQHILDEAYIIFGNPILAHDMDYKVIAKTEMPITDDPIWNEFETTGMVGHDRLVFFRDECFFEMAANAKKITFLLSDKLKYDRIHGKLFTKNYIQVGCACIVECCHPFEDDTPEFFEILCSILDKELSKSELFRNYGQTYMETLVEKLIENSIEDINILTAHIESIYIGTKPNLYLAVADITQCDPTHTNLAYFRDLFKQTQPAFKYAIYSNYIVIIISSDDATLHVKKDLNRLNRLFEQHNIYAGISSCFENLLELRKYYTEAVNALNGGLKNDGTQRTFQYKEIIQDS